MALPREILRRVESVYAYHQATKYSDHALPPARGELDQANRPSPYRIFE
jgi:hypothetical protein